MPAGAKKKIHRGGEQGFLFAASIDIGLCTGYLAGHSGEKRVILTSHAKIPITDHSSFLSGWMTAANQRILNHGIWFDSLCLCNIEELNRNTILNDVKSDCALFSMEMQAEDNSVVILANPCRGASLMRRWHPKLQAAMEKALRREQTILFRKSPLTTLLRSSMIKP